LAGTFGFKGKIGIKLSRDAFVHVVTYNHAKYIGACLKSLLSQKGFTAGENLHIQISDNNSSDNITEALKEFSGLPVKLIKHPGNFGFVAAHNLAFSEFLKSGASFYLCLNPDLSLKNDALGKLISAVLENTAIGCACPKLLRADENLAAFSPAVIDAAGMCITSDLRHFDRGSGELDTGQFNREEFVFGGSGACLLLKKEYVKDIIFDQYDYRHEVNEIYPELRTAPEIRSEVFDEAFFAYREDADLAWRSQLLGWKCMYVPDAVGFHVRKVTPEKRPQLPKEINLLGVKNRFLLQLNNYSFSYGFKVFFKGYVLRNMLVIAGVIFTEPSSFPGIFQFLKLFRRGMARRSILKKRMKIPHSEVALWFDKK
jgi:GT2 family glycosyltransferase